MNRDRYNLKGRLRRYNSHLTGTYPDEITELFDLKEGDPVEWSIEPDGVKLRFPKTDQYKEVAVATE